MREQHRPRRRTTRPPQCTRSQFPTPAHRGRMCGLGPVDTDLPGIGISLASLACSGGEMRITMSAPGPGPAIRKGTDMRIVAAALVAVVLTAWAPGTRAADYPADNYGKNVRDRQDTSPTSGDQSNRKSDLAITQAIRKAVV